MRVTIKSWENKESVFELIELIKSKYALERDMKLYTDNKDITVCMQVSDEQIKEPTIPDEELPF